MDLVNRKPLNYEQQRLAALRKFQITDTFNENEYDDIAKLASAICGTPVSLVTFVDESYQWFKAKVGTDFKGTPREIAFCEHTIREANQVMVVEDAAADPRFENNPLVTENPNIRFYAGAPFTTEDGFTLGTVCVLDVIPRKLSAEQINALGILSGQVMNLLKTRKMNLELNFSNKVLSGRNKAIKDDKIRLQGQLQVQATDWMRQLALKNEELDGINKELESFAYISSHDLQEPLRKIQTFVSYLTEKEIENLSPQGALFLQKIRTSSERMQRLIQDLLQYSKSSFSIQNFEETTLQLSLAPVLEDLRKEIQQKEAQINISGDGRLVVIKVQFQQLLYSLISNALKFSREATVPQIDLSLHYEFDTAAENPAHFVIKISDNGIGFDNQNSERIFTLFQRLVSTENVAGTGIGLTLVRKIVTNHGGKITAQGKINEGATFTIRIPEQLV